MQRLVSRSPRCSSSVVVILELYHTRGCHMAPKKRSSIRDLSREARSLREYIAGGDPPAITADRAAAIVHAATLDSALEDALAYKMVDLSKRKYESLFTKELAPLRSFHAKILVAHAFEIIGNNTLHDLTCIRLIRNAFAHARRPISFETEQISDECSKLLCVRHADTIESNYRPLDTPKQKYLFATGHIDIALMAVAQPDLASIFGPLLPLD